MEARPDSCDGKVSSVAALGAGLPSAKVKSSGLIGCHSTIDYTMP